MKAVVTGGSRGIGRAIVQALVGQGADVVAVGRNESKLRELALIAPKQITLLVGDLSVDEERDQIIPRASHALGGVDVLVNCAGIVIYEPVGMVSPESLERMWRINQLAPTLLAQDAAQVMVEQGRGGAIVNVSSTLASRAAPSTIGYAGTKGALEAITLGLAKELAPAGIRVNAVAPGVIDTDMVRTPRGANASKLAPAERERVVADQLEALASLHPLGRLGRADEVAALVLSVIQSEWMTGSVLTLDGGLSL